MSIALDATAIGSGLGGDETMLRGLLAGLVATATPGDAFTAYLRPGEPIPPGWGTQERAVRRLRRLPGPAHFSMSLPSALRRERPDLVVSVTHGPMRSRTPVALMLQDLSFVHRPDLYPAHTRVRLKRIVGRQVEQAAMVLTVSEFSRLDIVETYGLDPDRVHHVPNTIASPPRFGPEDAAAGLRWLSENGVDGPFFLYLGNLHPRKNVATALRAFADLRRSYPELDRHRFVVAGGRWWGDSEEARAAAEAPPGSVVFLGRVSDRHREALLHLATALVYVSRFEGFGLPPLEAMARGTPAVASRVTSLPEVTGGAALLVDPEDRAQLADALVQVTLDVSLRQVMIERGRQQAALFSPQSTGQALRRALGSIAVHQEVTSP